MHLKSHPLYYDSIGDDGCCLDFLHTCNTCRYDGKSNEKILYMYTRRRASFGFRWETLKTQTDDDRHRRKIA